MDFKQLLFSFDGRIRRTHYWLGNIGAGLVGGLIVGVIILATGGMGAMAGRGAGGPLAMIGGLLCLVVYAVLIWINLALLAKRWHDRDKGAIMILIIFIPIIGGLWTLVECGFLDGTQGPNKYGPSPKGIGGDQPTPAVA